MNTEMETLYAASAESLEVEVRTSIDPTAEAPAFCLTSRTSLEPGVFQPGQWEGTWKANRSLTAVTPLIGEGQVLSVTSGQTYRVWIRVRAGIESAVWPVGILKVA